jgi:flavin-dependent dehydrogenase
MMSAVPERTDVFVVGGGPAGLAAAIAARRQGFRVTVADVFRPPIDKACGEGLMPDSVAALRELGLDPDDVDTGAFRGIRFIGDQGVVEADFPHGCGVGIRRTRLHQALAQCAQEAGVTVLWGTRVAGIRDGALLVEGRVARCGWIIGADGQNSQVRRWAGLGGKHQYSRRLGARMHFAIEPWSEYVEIYWGKHGQAYVTPVGAREVGVALLSRKAVGNFASALQEFPALARRLGTAHATSEAKGAATVTCKLNSVARNGFALVGDASGSTDAITGEGLGLSFRQAIALARALAADDLGLYQAAHRKIGKLPRFMARKLLLMDRSGWIREHALRALSAKPALFRRLLAVHVGQESLLKFAVPGFIDLGWAMLTA